MNQLAIDQYVLFVFLDKHVSGLYKEYYFYNVRALFNVPDKR